MPSSGEMHLQYRNILVALGINPAFLAVLVEAHFTKFRGARDDKKNTNIIGDKVKLR